MSKKMFDIIIGNPPYQESDGGAGASATPVYNKFIDQAKTLAPEAMCYIIPAKWYSGGKGLDQFREDMLHDRRISALVDYTSSLDVFPGVDVAGGVCYFVWKEQHSGPCDYTNYHNGKATNAKRTLDEFDTFIRYPIAANIINRVLALKEKKLDDMVSTRKPFGLPTNVIPTKEGDLTLRYNKGIGRFNSRDITVGKTEIDKWKVIISYLTAEHAGQPDKNGQFRVLSTMEVLPPQWICSETYLLAGSFINKRQAENYMMYLKTKFVRFLVSQLAMTQHITKSMFKYVPQQDYEKTWSDESLYKKYGLTEEEISFIESHIKEMK